MYLFFFFDFIVIWEKLGTTRIIPIYACQCFLRSSWKKRALTPTPFEFLKLRVVINEDILLVLETVWGKKRKQSKAKELGKFSGSKRDLYLSIYQLRFRRILRRVVSAIELVYN